MDYKTFITLTVAGLADGAAFAAFALALVLIWRATRVVNFAQGVMAVASAYISITVQQHTGSFWLGFAAALISGALLGAAVESGVMRFASHSRPLNAVILALGTTFALQAVLGMIYTTDLRDTGNPYPPTNYHFVSGIGLPSNYNLFQYIGVAVLVGGLILLFSRTKLGLRLRASAFAPEVSRLLGINVAWMRTVGWMLASVAGALAAQVSLPSASLGVTPTAMDGIFIIGFTAAVLGGLDSPIGAVVGGLAVGLLFQYTTGYWDPQAPAIAVAILLFLVLLVRPNGIFSGAKARQV